MITTRTLKELFVILKNNEEHFKTGLCRLCGSLSVENIISSSERDVLKEYISLNRPKIFSRHFNIECIGKDFYWPRGRWKPRLKWIDDQIKKLS